MELQELAQCFADCTQSAFRLQALADYVIDEELDEYERFLAGQPLPDLEKDDWLKSIRQKIEAGVQICNVHVLPTRLTPYLRFAIDWSYIHRHLAGESIRFVSEAVARRSQPPLTQDFWLFDDSIAVVMRYDPTGHFLRAERVTNSNQVETYRAVRDSAIRQSFDLPHLLALRRQGVLV